MDIENPNDPNNTSGPVQAPKTNAKVKNGMAKLFESASKIVFMGVALAVIVALFTGHITGDQFMILASMTFTFYFANKGDVSKPFAGK